MEALSALEEFDIVCNKIGKLKNLQKLTSLQKLNISSNGIEKIEGLGKL
jgi:Leucine-rich repeat (LRR) protein